MAIQRGMGRDVAFLGPFSSMACHQDLELTNRPQAVATGQLNTILTFFEIQFPALPSELSDIPTLLLRKAIDVLRRNNRAQIIESADGGGVRFFTGSS